jgi:hypothetical protein
MDPVTAGIMVGGSLLSGLFGGKKNKTTTQQVQFPEEFKPLAGDLGALSQLLMQRPFTPYLGQRRAGLSPMTQAAIGRGYEIGMGQGRDYSSGIRFGGGQMPMFPQLPPGFPPYPQGPMGGGRDLGGVPPGATPLPKMDRPSYDPRQLPPGFPPYPQGPMGGGRDLGGMPPGATPVPKMDRPSYDPRQAMYGVGQFGSSAGPRQLGALSQFGSGFRR